MLQVSLLYFVLFLRETYQVNCDVLYYRTGYIDVQIDVCN